MATLTQKTRTVSTDNDNNGIANRIESQSWTYDKAGNLISYTDTLKDDDDGDGRYYINIKEEIWTYDKAGNQTSHTNKPDYDGDGKYDYLTEEIWTYDDNNNQTSYLYKSDYDGDGTYKVNKTEAWTYDYDNEGNLIFSTYKRDNNGDGIYDYMTQATRSYDVNGNLTRYALDEDGNGSADYILTFTIKYDAQGRLTEYNYAVDQQGDGITDESWTYHSRTYDENGNLRSLAVNYDGGQNDLMINYDPNGQITSYNGAAVLPLLVTPAELKLSANDSSGKVFEIIANRIYDFSSSGYVFGKSSFKGYANDILVVDTSVQDDTINGGSITELQSLYDLKGQPVYIGSYNDEGYGGSERATTTYTYDADDRVVSRHYSRDSGNDYALETVTETTNYDSKGQVISEINEEYYNNGKNSVSFRGERTFTYTYDTTGNLTAVVTEGSSDSDYSFIYQDGYSVETSSRSERLLSYNTMGNLMAEVEEKSSLSHTSYDYYDGEGYSGSTFRSISERLSTYNMTGNLVAETITKTDERDDDNDGDFDYKQTTNETYTYAESLPSDLLRIELYDAKSDTLITTLQDGDQISASTLLGKKIALAAFVPEDSLFSGQVESVFLNLNNGEVTRKENVEPYTLFSDFNGNFQGGVLPIGDNNITFDLYSQNNLKGDSLGTVTRQFTIVDDLAVALNVGLYDAETDTLITSLQDGDEISASTLMNREINIAAFVPEDNVFAEHVDSIFLNLNNGEVTGADNVEPYSLFGDFNGNFQGGILPVGNNNITFDLYSHNNLKGDLLGTFNLDFTVV